MSVLQEHMQEFTNFISCEKQNFQREQDSMRSQVTVGVISGKHSAAVHE